MPPRTTTGLAGLLLALATATPGAAENGVAAHNLTYPVACPEYVAEHMGCLDYRNPPEADARADVERPQPDAERTAGTRDGNTDSASIRAVTR